MEPLFSYFNIRDFSALLRTVSRSSFERLKKRTASTVFLWRFLSARREKFSRECFARIEIGAISKYTIQILILISRMN